MITPCRSRRLLCRVSHPAIISRSGYSCGITAFSMACQFGHVMFLEEPAFTSIPSIIVSPLATLGPPHCSLSTHNLPELGTLPCFFVRVEMTNSLRGRLASFRQCGQTFRFFSTFFLFLALLLTPRPPPMTDGQSDSATNSPHFGQKEPLRINDVLRGSRRPRHRSHLVSKSQSSSCWRFVISRPAIFFNFAFSASGYSVLIILSYADWSWSESTRCV